MELKKKRIFFIENDKIDQMAFERFAKGKDFPYDYLMAGSIKEAKKILDAEEFDAVVVDYLLGDGTALDLFGEIRNIPIIIVTGTGDQETAVKAMKAGAYDYLIKDPEGNHLQTLPVTVKNAIEHKRNEEELKRYRTHLEQLVKERTDALLKEINERKQTEKALQREKEYSNMIIETADALIVGLDLEGKVTLFNRKAEEVSGYSRAEILGKDFLKTILVGKGDTALLRNFQKLKEGKSTNPIDVFFSTKGGEERIISSQGSPLRDKEDTIIGVLGIGSDVTEKRKMEKQLIQSEKLKSLGELAGGVAHDFNNVLAAILGRVQLLMMTTELLPKKEKNRKSIVDIIKGLEVIEKASQDGAETVRRIQEFARRRDDDKYLALVNINEIISHSLEFTKLRWKDDAEAKGITIKIKKEFSPLSYTIGSAAELREVFTNLINNAIDALPEGGQITIKTLTQDNYIIISVEDTGTGISETTKDKVFDPFFTTKGPQATGLGMSVSYGIINRHRGSIALESAEGKGTTFFIKLPISEQEFKKEEKEKPIVGEQKKARILVIEDEGEVRQLLFDILINGSHKVETASDGYQGIEMFEKNEFDIVFTDLGMPGMSGWQVAEKIKKFNEKVPVALITGWHVDLEESVMRKSGVDFIIHKPFEVTQISRIVQEGMILRERFNKG